MNYIEVNDWRLDLQLGGNYATNVVSDGAIGYWRLGEAGGAGTAVDSSGYGRNGTVAGGVTFGQATTQPDLNTAALFNGSTGHIDMGDVSAFEFPGGDFTVELWAKFTDISGQRVAVGKSAFSTTAKGWTVMQHSVGSGALRFFGVDSAGSVITDVFTTKQFNDNILHYIVITIPAGNAGSGVRFYVDGALQQVTASGAGGTLDAGTVPFRIGGPSDTDNVNWNWNGTLDEVAIRPGQLTAAQIQQHYVSSMWTNVRKDVVAEPGIRFWRGNTRNGPKDRTSDAGGLEFSLRNDDRNTGMRQGYYSPLHANCRTGFKEGIAVRVVASLASVSYQIWTGTLRTIDPEPGKARGQRTHCTAQDVFGGLSETEARSIAPQVSQTETALITAVIGALPLEARPFATSLDTAVDTYPYAFDQMGDGAIALGLLDDIAINSLGFIYSTGNGTLVYENRHTRALKDSVFTLDGDRDGDAIVVPNSLEGTYNRVRVIIHPKSQSAGIVLYAATAAITVAPGQSVTVWGEYSDPNNKERLIGGTTFTTPLVATTDYLGNSAADGSGVDLTSSLTISVSAFASSVKFVITTSGSVTVYVTKLQLRGTGIYDNAPQTLESFSAQSYGDRPLDVDLNFQADPVLAQDLADYVRALYSSRHRVDAIRFKANRSPQLLRAALQREIGDVVTLSESVTGTTAVDVAINGIEWELSGGVWLGCTWYVFPQDQAHVFVLDDAVFGVLDSSNSVLGYA